MKTAASIFSWLGGIISVIADFSLIPTIVYFVGSTFTFYVIISIVFRLSILIWRQIAVSKGKKQACGICTLLFVSLIGGILTLCIPQEDLTSENDYAHGDGYSYYGRHNGAYSYGGGHYSLGQGGSYYQMSDDEKKSRIQACRNLYEKGIITESELNIRIKKLNDGLR